MKNLKSEIISQTGFLNMDSFDLQTESSFARWVRCCFLRRMPPRPAAWESEWRHEGGARVAAGRRNLWHWLPLGIRLNHKKKKHGMVNRHVYL